MAKQRGWRQVPDDALLLDSEKLRGRRAKGNGLTRARARSCSDTGIYSSRQGSVSRNFCRSFVGGPTLIAIPGRPKPRRSINKIGDRLLLPLFLCVAFFNDRLRRGQSCDRHHVRRRAHIIQSHLMAEFHAGRFATVLSANPDLEFRPGRSPAFDAPAHQLPDSVCVERLKWIVREYASLFFVDVVRQRTTRIIARQSHPHLREIIGPE